MNPLSGILLLPCSLNHSSAVAARRDIRGSAAIHTRNDINGSFPSREPSIKETISGPRGAIRVTGGGGVSTVNDPLVNWRTAVAAEERTVGSGSCAAWKSRVIGAWPDSRRSPVKRIDQ